MQKSCLADREIGLAVQRVENGASLAFDSFEHWIRILER